MHRWSFPFLTCGLAVSVFLSVASGYRPSGWQWQDSRDWQYNIDDNSWYYFFNGNPERIQSYQIGNRSAPPTTNPPTGWLWFEWPWLYSLNEGEWYFIFSGQNPVVENIRTGNQSVYGQGNPPQPDLGINLVLVSSDGMVEPFRIATTEVTKAQWNEVYDYAQENGYDLNEPVNCGANYPVTSVPWYDAVKWANAASEYEGLDPVYYTDSSLTTVYRSGEDPIGLGAVDSEANGYRLPSDAEWELAASGGPNGGGFIYSGSNDPEAVAYFAMTSFGSESDPALCPDQESVRAVDRLLPDGNGRSIWPVGQLEPNGLGTYDMSGNVAEWVFDHYDSSERQRTVRGGSFRGNAESIEVTARSAADPGLINIVEKLKTRYGFRVARNAPSDD